MSGLAGLLQRLHRLDLHRARGGRRRRRLGRRDRRPPRLGRPPVAAEPAGGERRGARVVPQPIEALLWLTSVLNAPISGPIYAGDTAAISAEQRAKGANVGLGPTINPHHQHRA